MSSPRLVSLVGGADRDSDDEAKQLLSPARKGQFYGRIRMLTNLTLRGNKQLGQLFAKLTVM